MIKFARIKQRLCSSQGQKISLTILMIGIFFFASTYAQTEATTETSKLLENTQYIIQRIIDFISRSWILLATLAGKFMSNDLVY